MKASVQYNDFIGTVTSDISDNVKDIRNVNKHFGISEKYEPIGFSLSGTDKIELSILCIDKEKSKNGQEYIVSIDCSTDPTEDKNYLDILFKRLNIVLYERGSKYKNLKINEEIKKTDIQ